MTPPPDPHHRHRFPRRSSAMLCGCTTCSASACATSNCFWPSGASSSATRPHGASARNSVRALPPACDASEVFIRIRGVQQYLWRAVDQYGVALDILVQARRDSNAAKRFFKRLLKGLQYVPRVIVTDKLRSYGVAQRQLLPGVEHRQSRYLNNRAENSHRPTRRREWQMQRFKSSEQAQDFLSAHSFIYGHFRPRRHRLSATAYRAIRSEAFDTWQQDTCARRPA